MRFNRVHAVCQQLRDGINCQRTTVCERCPASEKLEMGGVGTRMCYARAQEVINIAKIGWPWKRAPKSERGKSWRERVFR